MNKKALSIGVDIGGSHIACAAVNIDSGELLPDTMARADVDSMGGAADIFSAWAKVLNQALASVDGSRLAGIGFAMPGPFDYQNGTSKMERKFPGLFGKSIGQEIQPLLDTESPLSMRFLNDATSFAVGEAWLGHGQGADKVVAVTLGTGFGSAFIDAGVPVVKRDDAPGEGCLWHLPYRDGIVDDYFTTRWFVRQFKAVSGQDIDGAKSVAEWAHSGDASALGVFENFGRDLGEFLAPWLKKFNAEVVVFGGNISSAYDLFGPSLRDCLGSVCPDATIEVSLLGESAAMIGAARLFDDIFWKQLCNQNPQAH